MATSPKWSFLSSSLVKEVARLRRRRRGARPRRRPQAARRPAGGGLMDLAGRSSSSSSWCTRRSRCRCRPRCWSAATRSSRCSHEMQESLPEEIKQARWIVKDREELLGKARAEGDRIVEQAHEDQRRMAMKEAVAKRRAEEEAAQILQEAEDDHRRACDARPRTTSTRSSRSSRSRCARSSRTRRRPRGALAKTLDQVEVGRDRLRAPTTAAEQELAPPRPCRRSPTELFDGEDGGEGFGCVLATIDVRDLLGHPGLVAFLRPVSARSTASRPSWSRVPDDAVLGGRPPLESVIEGILVSGSCRPAVAPAVRAMPHRIQTSRSIVGPRRAVRAPCSTRRTPTTYRSVPQRSRSTPTRSSATRSGSRCRSRRCAGPTARACARRAAATATSASARATTPSSIRGSRSCRPLARAPDRPTTRPEAGRPGGTDGRPKKKQSKTRTAKRRATWKSDSDRVQLVSRNASSPSCRTACAGTAGTTQAGRRSRSSSRVAMHRSLPRSTRSTARSASRSVTPGSAKRR